LLQKAFCYGLLQYNNIQVVVLHKLIQIAATPVVWFYYILFSYYSFSFCKIVLLSELYTHRYCLSCVCVRDLTVQIYDSCRLFW